MEGQCIHKDSSRIKGGKRWVNYGFINLPVLIFSSLRTFSDFGKDDKTVIPPWGGGD